MTLATGLGNTGESRPSGSPCGKSAAQFIVDTVNAHPGQVTLLALASLTNVALALHLDPSIASKLHRLVYLGGAFFVMGNVNPACEANVWHDPEAADWVLGSFPEGVTHVVGLDVTTRSIMSGAHLEALRDSGGRFGSYCWSICQFYKAYHQRVMGLDGIYLHDPTAYVAAVEPELFTWTDGAVKVATDPGCARGKTLLDTRAKKWALANDWTTRPGCRVALDLDASAVLERIMARLSE
jgi:uridine nucleosidase